MSAEAHGQLEQGEVRLVHPAGDDVLAGGVEDHRAWELAELAARRRHVGLAAVLEPTGGGARRGVVGAAGQERGRRERHGAGHDEGRAATVLLEP